MALLVSVLGLAGCGGGGGGGSDASIEVSFSPATVAMVADKGLYGSAQVSVVVTAAGITANNLFFDGDGGDAVLADARVVSQSGTSVTIELVGRNDLPAGSYTDRLRLLLCRDPACASQYAGSPVLLPIRYEVRPALELPAAVSLARNKSDPPVTTRVPMVLPASAATVQVVAVDTFMPGLFTARVEGAQLVLEAGYAPPGNYSATVRVHTVDGRYTAATTVSYDVTGTRAENDLDFISYSAVTPRLSAPQATSTRQAITVRPPHWTPVLALQRVLADPPVAGRFTVVDLGGGQFDYRFDSTGLAPGEYSAQVVYATSLGQESTQVVQLSVSSNLVANAVLLPLTSVTTAAELSGQVGVSMADGRALAWQVDPATVPAWLTLTASSGQTGRDSIRFTVDPLRVSPTAPRTAELRVTVPDANVNAATALVSLDDRLPRLVASLAPVLELGQQGTVHVRGYFPEDVVANGKLEVSGATVQATEWAADALVLHLANLSEGVPVQLRLRYAAAQSSVSIPVTAVPQVAAAVFPLAFGTQRPPVYSSRHQAFYFIAEGLIQRLANQGGTWVRSTATAFGGLDLALTPDQSQLLVLAPLGITRHDPVSLVNMSSLITFAEGPASAELATTRNKLLATTMRGQVAWITDGTRCDGRMWRMNNESGGVPEAISLPCNNTTSQAGLAASRDHRYLTLFQNDAGKSPLVMDSMTQQFGNWPSGTGFTPLGLAATAWSSGTVQRGDGYKVFVGFSSSGIFASPEARGNPLTLPAGTVAAGFAMSANNSDTLVYSYRRGTDGAGNPSAPEPQLLRYGISSPTANGAYSASLALPQAAGCLAGRPVDEPCDHRVHLLPDLGDRHMLVLGPQAAMVVPLNAMVPVQQPQGAGRSLLRGRTQRVQAPGR